MISKEVWKTIDGYGGHYEISNKGNVRRIDIYVPGKNGLHLMRGRMVTQYNANNDPRYKRVRLTYNNKAQWVFVHRLVADAFLEKTEGKTIVNHLDNDPSNNNVANLEWTTQKGNIEHSVKQGRHNHKSVIRIDENGNKMTYFSMIEAAKDVGLKNPCNISFVCNPKRHNKTAAGYYWQYA